MLEEGRGDKTDRESAKESVSTSASAKRDADLGVKATRTDRELHEREL